MSGDVLGISIAPMFGNPVSTYAPLFIDVDTGNTAEYCNDEFRSFGFVLIPTLENPSNAGRIGNQYIPLVTVEFGMNEYFSLHTYLHFYLPLFIPIHLFMYVYLCLSIHLPPHFVYIILLTLLHRFSKPNIITYSSIYNYPIILFIRH